MILVGSRRTSGALRLLGLALAAVVGTLVARSITSPLSRVERRLREIADGDGDLTQRVDERRRDELGALGRAFNRFAGQVQEMVVQVAAQARILREGAGDVARASEETGQAVGTIAVTVEALAGGSADQARATQAAANQRLRPVYHLDKARVVVSIDDDDVARLS